MSIFYDMMLHLFNSFITIVYFMGVMKVEPKRKLFNGAGVATALFVSAIVSHIFRYTPPIRFMAVLAVMLITAFAFFEASFISKIRAVCECIALSMIGEMFGMVVCSVMEQYGFTIMEYDTPERAIMSLVLSAFTAGMVPIMILLRKRARVRELWRVAIIQAAIMFTQISMIMIAFFDAGDPSRKLVYIITVIQIPGILLSLFCTRAILSITKVAIGEKEQEFEKTKADMEYDYYKLALESNEKLSMLRHDLSNTLQTAMTLIRNGDIRKGNELLCDIDRENRSITPVVSCDNDIINVILTLKHKEMEMSDICFGIDIHCELANLPVSDRELVSIITNLLDNATEACKKCIKRKKEVSITFGKQQGFYIIKVENSYCPDEVYIPESVYAAISTKTDKEHHGMGLRVIYEICRKYDGNLSMYEQNGKVVSVVTFAHGEEVKDTK